MQGPRAFSGGNPPSQEHYALDLTFILLYFEYGFALSESSQKIILSVGK